MRVQPNPGPAWIAFDSMGHAFAGNRNGIAQFTVNPTTGAISSNGITATPNLNSLGVVDPSGRFLYTADGSPTISGFTIGSSGALTPNGSVSLGACNRSRSPLRNDRSRRRHHFQTLGLPVGEIYRHYAHCRAFKTVMVSPGGVFPRCPKTIDTHAPLSR